MPKCRELGIGVVPYSPLGHGFFGGKAVIESVHASSFLVLGLEKETQRDRENKL